MIAAREDLNEKIQFTANAHGSIAQPFDCWLILRGLKTLPLRLRQHEENAHTVADFLNQNIEAESEKLANNQLYFKWEPGKQPKQANK